MRIILKLSALIAIGLYFTSAHADENTMPLSVVKSITEHCQKIEPESYSLQVACFEQESDGWHKLNYLKNHAKEISQ